MPTYRLVAFGDLHAPTTHQGFWEWLCQTIKDESPDVIVNVGDWFEGEAGSRFAKDERKVWTIMKEFQTVADQMKAINELAPNAQKVWLWGNHEAHIFQYDPQRMNPDMRALIQARYEECLKPLLDGWIVKPYGHRQNWYIGQLGFRHGSDVSAAAVTQDMGDYCPYNGLLVTGHTHRPMPVTQLRIGKALWPFHAANCGTGADWEKMHYMDNSRLSQWGRGALVAEVSSPGILEGKRLYSSPKWKAEMRIHSMASGNWSDTKL